MLLKFKGELQQRGKNLDPQDELSGFPADEAPIQDAVREFVEF